MAAISVVMVLGGDAGSRAGDSVPARAPARLSETGLYKTPGVAEIDPRNLPYAPQYPLWTDGAAKSRWIFLPEQTRIDVSKIDQWRFPVGTKLWKEFAFGGRKVETRMLWHASEEVWVFAAYVWNDDQTEALLAPDEGVRDHVEIAPGKRYSIPGVVDCHSCHLSAPTPVLGFNALQLSDDRDPMAPHADPLRPGMITLRSLLETGRLDPPRRDLVDSPPRIRASSPTARAALGYLAGNCGHCHNATGPLGRLGLVLAHDAGGAKGSPEPAIATALGAPGHFLVPGLPEGASRLLAPGAPERSALLYRMISRRPSSQMPPLGTVIRDEEAVRLVGRWIAEEFPSVLAATRPGQGPER